MTDSPQSKTAADTGLARSHDELSAALTVEAMRLGVVPDAELGAYTVGRDAELSLVARDLERVRTGPGQVRAFLGDYGTGKTHLLELIQTAALKQNFLVAQVVLDPRETPPSHPKRVYRALVRSLRYPEQTGHHRVGLKPLLSKAVENEAVLREFGVSPVRSGSLAERIEQGDHLYLSAALSYLARLKSGQAAPKRRKQPLTELDVDATENLLLSWLEGHPTISNQEIDRQVSRTLGRGPKIYSLIDYRPWARIYAYMLSGLSHVARLVGYSGLVVLLDEAEFYALLSRDNREFAETLFQALTHACVGVGGGDPEMDALPFSSDEIGKGGYGIQRELTAVYPPAGNHTGLYTVYAMTPNPDGIEALHKAVPKSRVTELGRLSREDYIALARKVCDFYVSARPHWQLSPKIVTPLGKVLSGLVGAGLVDNPRQAMKFIIEFIDVVRYAPDQVGTVVRNLQDTLAF